MKKISLNKKKIFINIDGEHDNINLHLSPTENIKLNLPSFSTQYQTTLNSTPRSILCKSTKNKTMMCIFSKEKILSTPKIFNKTFRGEVLIKKSKFNFINKNHDDMSIKLISYRNLLKEKLNAIDNFLPQINFQRDFSENRTPNNEFNKFNLIMSDDKKTNLIKNFNERSKILPTFIKIGKFKPNVQKKFLSLTKEKFIY